MRTVTTPCILQVNVWEVVLPGAAAPREFHPLARAAHLPLSSRRTNVELVITGRHVEITPNLHQLIEETVHRLDRYTVPLHGVSVVVSKAHDTFEVEMTLGVRRGVRLAAHANGDDVKGAVRVVETRIETQLIKFKERSQAHRGKRVTPQAS